MACEDLTGKTFGKLTVLEMYDPEHSRYDGYNDLWLCKCECGRTRIAKAFGLKYGRIRYCGKCSPPPKPTYLCRHCEFGEPDDLGWYCSKRESATKGVMKCTEYWCSAVDKINGNKCREGRCLICGKPVYAHSTEVPLYCYEHRAQAKEDDKVFDEAPFELLFGLIAAIFLRARDDYLTNSDNQRSDAERFLRGNWAQELSLAGFDAQDVLDRLNEEMLDEFK